MGLRVVAVDVGEEKLKYSQKLGAEFQVDATDPDIVQKIMDITDGGCHGVVCFATQPKAFKTAVDISRRKGTVVPVGLPAGGFDCPIFDIVLKRVTIRGSIVGTRKDLQEAVDYASRGLVKCQVEMAHINDVESIFDRLRKGQVMGRIVLDLSKK